MLFIGFTFNLINVDTLVVCYFSVEREREKKKEKHVVKRERERANVVSVRIDRTDGQQPHHHVPASTTLSTATTTATTTRTKAAATAAVVQTISATTTSGTAKSTCGQEGHNIRTCAAREALGGRTAVVEDPGA